MVPRGTPWRPESGTSTSSTIARQVVRGASGSSPSGRLGVVIENSSKSESGHRAHVELLIRPAPCLSSLPPPTPRTRRFRRPFIHDRHRRRVTRRMGDRSASCRAGLSNALRGDSPGIERQRSAHVVAVPREGVARRSIGNSNRSKMRAASQPGQLRRVRVVEGCAVRRLHQPEPHIRVVCTTRSAAAIMRIARSRKSRRIPATTFSLVSPARRRLQVRNRRAQRARSGDAPEATRRMPRKAPRPHAAGRGASWRRDRRHRRVRW